MAWITKAGGGRVVRPFLIVRLVVPKKFTTKLRGQDKKDIYFCNSFVCVGGPGEESAWRVLRAGQHHRSPAEGQAFREQKDGSHLPLHPQAGLLQVYNTVLFCTVLFYFPVLHFTCCNVLNFTALCSTVFYFTLHDKIHNIHNDKKQGCILFRIPSSPLKKFYLTLRTFK